MFRFLIPNEIRSFLLYLEHAGFQAYLVGGCVRDGLLGITPHDWDVCTNATPQQIQTLFQKTYAYGIRHGTVTVHWEDLLIEVTTFRAENEYTDHRRPDQVVFIQDLQTDLARRDFTVNAIAMDANGFLCDPFNGLQDLKSGVIRAVGEAEKRFEEDALRMLRAIRFSAQLGFEIEGKTYRAIIKCAPLAASLSKERITAEIEKTLLTSSPERVSDMITAGLLKPWMQDKEKKSLHKLKCIEAERIRRWCGFFLLIQDQNLIQYLRLDRKTMQACKCCFEIRKTNDRDNLFWKQMICHYGSELASIAADVISALDSTSDRNLLRYILQSGDCCALADLAVDGNDVKALGFQGPEIRTALSACLQLVWQHPERNEREILLKYLREEYSHG